MLILILHVFIFILSLLFLFPLSLLAVELDSTAFPDDVNSAMYSLEALCNRLQDGATGVKRGAKFVEPPLGPITGVGCSLNEAMGAAPVADNTSGAIPDEVLSGKTFWGLRTDGYWGLQTGTLANQEIDNNTVNQLAGYYSAFDLSVSEVDLVSENIKADINIFGIDGDPNVVNTFSGDADPADIINGKKAWVDGEEVIGTLMIDIPTQQLSDSTTTVEAGKYEMTILEAVDPDLVSSNIKDGVTIFGITGNPKVVDTSSGDAEAADIISGKIAWVKGTKITGALSIQTLSDTTTTLNAGVYQATTLEAIEPDLVSSNIKGGVDIFGITGEPTVVDTSSGNAEASDILSGKKAWVDGMEVTGSGTINSLATLLATGQILCYDSDGAEIPCATTGQDGDHQQGATTSPRFTDNGDGTITDNLSGLIWLKKADCYTNMNWISVLSAANGLQDDHCGLDDDSNKGDWRLPNIRELYSLIDFSQDNPALPSGHEFSNVLSQRYWSATTANDNTKEAWTIDFKNGTTSRKMKTEELTAWPVKGGQ